MWWDNCVLDVNRFCMVSKILIDIMYPHIQDSITKSWNVEHM